MRNLRNSQYITQVQEIQAAHVSYLVPEVGALIYVDEVLYMGNGIEWLRIYYPYIPPVDGLVYKGVWNASTNNPILESGEGTTGDFYIVNTAGTTNLDGITDWQVGDWAIFEGGVWQKVDNHDIQSYTTVKDENTQLPKRSVLKFTGTGVTATDEGGETVVNIEGNIPATNYGLFTQTGNSIVITGTTTESTLINGGLGTLSVPANGFQVGDSFRGDFAGVMSAKNNDTIRIRVKAGSVILADSGVQTMPATTNAVWSLSINFTIRQIGGAGTASIVTLGNFLHVKQSNGVSEGFGFNTVNNTTFNTTVSNTLNVTVQWSSNSGLNSIYSDIFVLNKIY
jgi:hypothetical protein